MAELFGLVMAGGGSRRMKRDKASLPFGPGTLLEHTLEVVQSVCNPVFVSCRENQWTLSAFPEIDRLPDATAWKDSGPIGGIITALHHRPGQACLVVACDMPFIDALFLKKLIARRDTSKLVTMVTSSEGKYLEPLCAIYEPSVLGALMEAHSKKQYALHRAVEDGGIGRVVAEDRLQLTNLNDRAAYEHALSLIKPVRGQTQL